MGMTKALMEKNVIARSRQLEKKDTEIERLKRELARKELEIEILKKKQYFEKKIYSQKSDK